MPDLRTEITEVVTALGLSGRSSLAAALAEPPGCLANVPTATLERLSLALSEGRDEQLFQQAWANGTAFLSALDGLRGRKPLSIEWRGPSRPVGYEFLPADLRVDHVYLISCKYSSRVLFNPSPAHLFDRGLGERPRPAKESWYATVAPDAYQRLYDAALTTTGLAGLPVVPNELDVAQRRRLQDALPARWSGDLLDAYLSLCEVVSAASADRWRTHLTTQRDQELMLWRLLRFASAPYFVLGSSRTGSLRFRVATPWDWRQCFDLESLAVAARPAGQPTVDWEAHVVDHVGSRTQVVRGHVEVRWSHGRFSSVEAKVYLDSAHGEVPGYFPLGGPA